MPMKRQLLVAVALVLFAFQASAQFSMGITGGLNFCEARFADVNMSAPVRYHLGMACNVDLSAGFSIQPALTFVTKEAYFNESTDITMNYIEVPVSFQWGPDLLLFRPFVDVSPFVGCLLTNNVDTVINDKVYASGTRSEGRQIFEYGCGVGGGIDIWKLRIVARYNWNFGSVFVKDYSGDLGKINLNDHFKGLSLSLSLFFF